MSEANLHVGFDANASTGRSPQRYTLLAGEVLFREGEAKSGIYRVESGAICTYALAASGKHALPEFIYAGDWLGFGYLDRHANSACAVVTTRVSFFPLSWANTLIEIDPKARQRLLEAVAREFAFAHPSLVKRDTPKPIERVAALLLKLASKRSNETPDPHFIVDSMPYGIIANSLAMSIDALADILIVLEMRDIIEPHVPEGLRLKDISALEEIASRLAPLDEWLGS